MNKISTTRLVLDNQEKISEDLICPICKHILQDPQACDTCVKVFCKSCIDMKIELYKACVCGGEAKDVKKAPKVIRQMLQKKFFFCIFQEFGCKEKIPYNEIEQHEQQCQFKQIDCVNKGCNKKFTKQALEEHLKQCEYQLKKCQYCQQEYPQIELELHEQNCDESIKECDGCKKKMKKKELEIHHKICEEVTLECYHCEKQFLRPKFEEHNSLKCLKDLIFQFEEEYLKKVKIYQEMINSYLDKLKEKEDEHLKLFCKKCRRFSCREILTKCFLCKQFICITCSKKELKNCNQCKQQYCEQCLDYSMSNSKCYFCESNEIIQSSTTKSYYCRRTDCLKNYDMEKKIIKYTETNQFKQQIFLNVSFLQVQFLIMNLLIKKVYENYDYINKYPLDSEEQQVLNYFKNLFENVTKDIEVFLKRISKKKN